MPKYRVLTRSFINNHLVEADTVVDYDGIPSTNLEPLDPPAVQAAGEAIGADIEALGRQKAAVIGGDPDAAATQAAVSAAADAAATALAQGTAAAGLV